MMWVYVSILVVFFIGVSVLSMMAEDEGIEYDPIWILTLSFLWPIAIPLIVLTFLAATIVYVIKNPK